MRRRGGFSLVEAEIAIVLLGAGLLAVAATGVRAVRLLHEAEAVQGASARAASVLDSLAQLEAPVDGATLHERYALHWRTWPAGSTERVLLVVRYIEGGLARADTFALITGRWPVRIAHVP
jgi:hypothetical protein